MAIPAYPATDASCVYVPGTGRYLDAVLADLCKLDVLLRVRGLPGTSVTFTLDDAAVQSRIGASGVEVLRLPALGLWNMHVAKDAYAYDVQVPVYRYGITEAWALAQKPFYDCTPEEIGAICEAGQAGRFWRVGDEHKITLKSGEEVTVQIADFDHDVGPDGQVLPLTLVTKDCALTTAAINKANTNVGGWNACMMRSATIQGILANWPADWQRIMSVTKKQSGQGGASSLVSSTEDVLWLLSQAEVYGVFTNSAPDEGTQYPVFANTTSRIKKIDGVASSWWLRSANVATNSGFICVSTAGNAGPVTPNEAKGVVYGFCVGGAPTVPEAPDEGGEVGDIIDLTASMEKTDDADTLSETSMICSGKLVACTFGYKFAVSKAEDRQVLTFDPQYAPPATVSMVGYHLRSGNIQEATFEVRPNGSIWIIGAGTTYMYGKVNHLYWTLP